MNESVIEMESVCHTYPTPSGGVKVLDNVTFSVQRGEYVAITGASGSGKSTLLNVLGLLNTPTEGRYSLMGHDARTLPERKRNDLRGSAIGFVFQSFHLLAGRSALENAAVSGVYSGTPRKERTDRARSALEAMGLGDRAEFSVEKLSGGERQRVAIARAISSNPDLLLCDEPTGNLDRSNTQKILEILTELNRAGRTIVVITHDQNVAAHAAIRFELADGVLNPAIADWTGSHDTSINY